MSLQNSFKEKTKDKLKEPKHYNVIMHNDDFTSMEFVVMVLIEVFNKDRVSAEKLMLTVHRTGRAAVGSYPYDIAVTKTEKALSMARAEGFPFRMTVEEN